MTDKSWQDQRDEAQAGARGLLSRWAEARRQVDYDRDHIIVQALRAGVSVSEIHRLTGCSRSTIDRIAAAGQVQNDD